MGRYYIVVYDINEKRVAKVHKILRAYLQWRQRSVFEGYLESNEVAELKRKPARARFCLGLQKRTSAYRYVT